MSSLDGWSHFRWHYVYLHSLTNRPLEKEVAPEPLRPGEDQCHIPTAIVQVLYQGQVPRVDLIRNAPFCCFDRNRSSNDIVVPLSKHLIRVVGGVPWPADRATVQIIVARFGVLAALLVLWWASARFLSTSFIPTPSATLDAAVTMIATGRLQKALLESLSVFASGYLLAAAVAIPVGLLMGGFRLLGRTLEIYVNALTATPRVAFIPLLIVLLGLDAEAKITIIFLGAVMPILINTYAGVAISDPELIEMARSAGATRFQIFRSIMLPSALPFILAGLRLGAAIGLISTVVAELYTAVNGLGGLLSVYGNTFQMAPYFVVVLTLGLIGVAVTQIVRLAETRLSRWRYDAGETR